MSKLVLTDPAEIQLILALRGPRGGDVARFGLVAAPVKPRTFATKAERAVGMGFECPQCKRNDLRTATKSGSFHDKDVKGNKTEVCTIA